MADLVINDINFNSLSGSSISATTANLSNIFAANTTISSSLSSPVFSGLTIYSGGTNIENVFTLSGDSRLSVQNEVRVKKNPGYGEFSSITQALSSITTNSSTNKFRVSVGPGIFIEDTVVMKSFVEVCGSGIEATTIQVDNPSKNVIVGTDNSLLSDVFITGAISSGSTGILYSGNGISNFTVEDVRFGENNILVKVIGSGSSSNCLALLNNIKYGDGYYFDKGFIATNSGSGVGRILLRNSTTISGLFTIPPSVVAIADAPNCQIVINAAQIRNGGAISGTCIQAENGGVLRLTSVNINGFDKAIYMPNIGSAPSLRGLAVNFENNNNDVIVEHPGATGKIGFPDSQSKVFINENSSVFIPYKDSHIITVAKKGGDFTSIASAITFITGASLINRYEVLVGPGVFYEPEIVVPSYVSIVGSSIETTIVIPDGNHHIFRLENPIVELSYMNISGATSGKAGIFVKDCGNFTQVHKLQFNNCDIGILMTTSSVNSQFYAGYVDFNGMYSYGAKVESTNGFEAFANFENYYNFPTTGSTPYGTYVTGEWTNVHVLTNGGIATSGGTAFYAQDGAILDLLSVSIKNWDTAIHAANVGVEPTIVGLAVQIDNSINYDLLIEHPGTIGSFQGSADMEKVSIDSSSPFNINIQDTTTGNLNISNALNVRYSDGTITDVSTLIVEGSPMGVMEGGDLSIGTGFTVNIDEGFGYFEKFPDNDILKKLTWSATSINLSANTNNYIFFNNNGILSKDSTIPDTFYNILLGRAVTNSSGITFIDETQLAAEHIGNRLSIFARDGIGAVYNSGSLVTKNSTPFHLDASQGKYFFAENKFLPTGGTNVNFTSFYRDGSGGFIRSATTIVNGNSWDNNSGILTGLTSSSYTKHTLYTVGQGINEKYFLVYGQEEFSSLVLAESGNIPSPPSFFNDGVVLIAGIIVQKGSTGITEIQSLRPIVGFQPPTVTATNFHGNLLGLGNDDHTQYLLVNGSRAMSGDLSLGGNNIISAATINGIIIESHSSRHLPNGADPLSSATPVSLSNRNFIGISNAFARSDHEHAHDPQSGGTLHSVATTSLAGFMSATDKTYFDTIPNVFNTKANLSGATFTNGVTAQTFTATTISGGTLFSGSTNIENIFASTGLTTSLQAQLNTKANLSGATFTNGVTAQTFTASTISGGTILSGSTNLSNIFAQFNDLTHIQNGINTFTGGTTVNPSVNITAATLASLSVSGNSTFNTLSANTISGGTIFSGSTNIESIFASTGLTANLQAQLNTKANLSGATFTNGVTAQTFTASTISGGTIFSGSTNLSNIFAQFNDLTHVQNGINTFTGGTAVNPSVNITAATLSSLSVSGNSNFNTLSATTLSGGTILSGSTNLSSVFAQFNDLTHAQNGINTFTGGTAQFPTVNITAATLSSLSVSGNSNFNALSATTLSGGTIFSGSTNIERIFASTGLTTSLQAQLNTKANLSGATFTNGVTAQTFTATTISGGTIFSGSTNLSDLFHQKSGYLLQKSGVASGSTFAGNPKTVAITFTTAFPNNNYAVVVNGEPSRTWSIESKAASGFTINSNANGAFTTNAFWIALETGEGFR